MYKSGLILVFAIAFLAISCSTENKSASNAAAQSPAASTETANNVQPTPPQAPQTADAQAAPTGPVTTMEFDKVEHDYGTIMEGEKVRHTFTFTNTGDEPLIISNCKGSCGCTVPQCPTTPVATGEKGEIVVEFNSRGKGKVGGKPDQKRVTITANTNPPQTFLTLKGIVDKEESAPSTAANQ